MPNLVGTGLNQVPTNSMLGGLAYQNAQNTSIENLNLKNISLINSEIADTAIDVFVYDTSKDSDGGAWRKRTQHTSWYNETLNTSTRGNRREFPAVAVIVAETATLTIYDGDDPDLPMWMVFEANTDSADLFINDSSSALTSIAALNGRIFAGSTRTSTTGNITGIDFVGDRGGMVYTSSSDIRTYKGGIGKRNDGVGNVASTSNWFTNGSIVNRDVNDVAMTVLPNALIDSATELPVPTIAVATDGGISVIKDDGTVVDMYPNDSGERPALQIGFTKSNKLIFRHNFNWVYYYEIPSSDLNAPYWNGLGGYIGRFTSIERTWDDGAGKALPINTSSNIDEFLEDKAMGHTNGVNILAFNEEAIGHGMHAGIATNFNTGYMHGDIKGAFLSDTDTTNVTGSEKIANYNFAADFSTQWEVKNNANTSYDASNDRVTVTSTQNYSGIRLKNASLPTLTNGKRYIMTVDIHSINNPIRFGVVSGGTKNSVNSTGPHTLTFTAGASITEVFVEKPTGSNSTFVLNSVSIREAEEDHSINNNGFQVFGTITKSAVATGAELVGYSGYTNSNYLKQPYNSVMDFGTGDLSVTWWQYITGDILDGEYVFDRQGGSGNRWAIYYTEHDSGRLYFYATDGSAAEIYAENINNYKDRWTCYTVTRSSSGHIAIYIDGKIGYQSGAFSPTNVTNTSAELFIGIRHSVNSGAATQAKYALMRFSKTIPSEEQIKKIYEDEKFLFQENAKATLYGSSDAVTALAFDEATNLLHVGTSAGRSDFNGLRRINNTTTAVTTVISAHDGSIAQQ